MPTTREPPLPAPDPLPDLLTAGADTEVVEAVAAVVAVPRVAPADSFTLHAPLELAARSALLPYVRPEHRSTARSWLVALARAFASSGPPVPAPDAAAYDSIPDAATAVVAAIDAGDLDRVDAASRWLGRTASAPELRALLAASVVPRLAAAGHAPIFLYLLPRVAGRGELTGELLRGLARELAREPAWRLRWVDDRPAGPASSPDELFDVLASTPRIGTPAETFIYPLMSYVDEHGIAAGLLSPVTGTDDLAATAGAVQRAAAWSMLTEPGDHAPYGWTHCLTLPQAVLGVAGELPDPSVAVAVAATYVVGFRSALAVHPLEPVVLPDPGVPLAEAFPIGPAAAAGAAWHAPPATRARVRAELATRASVRRDAHLVKYTLACFDAAAADPGAEALYLAAAASLAAWWTQHGDDDPLGP
jgi:hypothetical protein